MQYDLLSPYLEGPHFAYLEEASWTDESKKAIRDYLVHELPPVVRQVLFADSTEMSIEDGVSQLLDHCEPGEVALMVRDAAVVAVPSLYHLMSELGVIGLTQWPNEDARGDTAVWLEAHTTGDQLNQFRASLAELRYWPSVEDISSDFDDITRRVTPADLRLVWRHAISAMTPHDLTDIEWQLLKPLLPPTKDDAAEQRARQAVNGILYRYVRRTSWARVPGHYGPASNLAARHTYYINAGIYERTLEALASNPDAARLVEWLSANVYASRRTKRA